MVNEATSANEIWKINVIIHFRGCIYFICFLKLGSVCECVRACVPAYMCILSHMYLCMLLSFGAH